MGVKHLGGHAKVTHVDMGVLRHLHSVFDVRSVLDIGCGPGGMYEACLSLSIEWTGVDGDAEARQLFTKRTMSVVDSLFVPHDFVSGPLETGPLIRPPYDLVWSVEFLEHVDEAYQANYMAAFAMASRAFVTAAPPGKSGYHHVNCRDQEYWVKAFGRYGWTFNAELTEQIRECATMKREFVRETGMVFEAQAKP